MGMVFKLDIQCDNDAFKYHGQDDEDTRNNEVIRLLEDVIKRVDSGFESGTIQDTNGNTVGRWQFTKD